MKPKRSFQLAVSVLGACIVGYFLYHTIEGERGWLAQVRLQGEYRAAQENLAKLQKERGALENRVKLMRPESLDPDLLEEQARKTLNFSKPNEIVILTPGQESSSGGR